MSGAAGPISYAPRTGRPPHADRHRIPALDRLRTRLQIRWRAVPGHRRVDGGDGAAADLRLAERKEDPADAPDPGGARVGVRHRHAGPARRALPAVEGLGVLLDRRPRIRG